MRVLPEGYQLYRLRAALLVEHHRVGHQVGQVLVGGVDVDLHEDEDAVVRGDFHVAELRACHAIDVDAVVGLLAARQRNIDLHGRPRRVPHRERPRARRDGGEHRVEQHRVRRKLQLHPIDVIVPMARGHSEGQCYRQKNI